jgi:hypothetical protein
VPTDANGRQSSFVFKMYQISFDKPGIFHLNASVDDLLWGLKVNVGGLANMHVLLTLPRVRLCVRARACACVRARARAYSGSVILFPRSWQCTYGVC